MPSLGLEYHNLGGTEACAASSRMGTPHSSRELLSGRSGGNLSARSDRCGPLPSGGSPPGKAKKTAKEYDEDKMFRKPSMTPQLSATFI